MKCEETKKQVLIGALCLLLSPLCVAAALKSNVFTSDGVSLGTITFEDSQYGLLILPHLSGLPQGSHGFHIHQYADCGDHGMNAGGHLDPGATNSHQGPYHQGHLGDLPVLVVDSSGVAIVPTLAPRLKTHDIKGHSVMIHQGSDNYTDVPPLGGGGARIACGKIIY